MMTANEGRCGLWTAVCEDCATCEIAPEIVPSEPGQGYVTPWQPESLDAVSSTDARLRRNRQEIGARFGAAHRPDRPETGPRWPAN